MRKGLAAAMILVGVLGSSLASADPPAEVRRDPEGRTGIGPVNEALAKGRKAVAEKDSDAAAAAFAEAAKLDNNSLLARLLMGQVRLMRNDLPRAREALDAGAAAQGNDLLKANRLLLLADLTEREARATKPDAAGPDDARVTRWDKAGAAWDALSAGFPMVDKQKLTADDRKKQVTARQQREKDYAGVRARIKKGEDVPPPAN